MCSDYSERPGTQALKIDHVVSPEEKHRRSQRLLALSDEKTKAFYARHIGKEAISACRKIEGGNADAWLYGQLYPGGTGT